MVDSISLLRRQLDLKETLIDAVDAARRGQGHRVRRLGRRRRTLGPGKNQRPAPGNARVPPRSRARADDGEQISELRAALSLRAARSRLRPTAETDELRPTCDRARVAVAMGDTNPRYVSENVLRLALDPAERTTFDLFGEEARLLDENENGTLNDPRATPRGGSCRASRLCWISPSPAIGARGFPRTAPPAARRGSTPPRPRVTRRCAPPATRARWRPRRGPASAKRR